MKLPLWRPTTELRPLNQHRFFVAAAVFCYEDYPRLYFKFCINLIASSSGSGIKRKGPLRINDEHRIVYKVENKSVYIAQLRYRY